MSPPAPPPTRSSANGLRLITAQTARTPDLAKYTVLSGELTEPDPTRPYKVRYTSLRRRHGHWVRPLLLPVVNIGLEAGFLFWLLQPQHRPRITGGLLENVATIFVIATIALMETLRLVNTVSLSVASIMARDPIPVTPPSGLRVAFLTTIVPGSESFDTVRETLRAALRITYASGVHVWLLDEGNDPEIKRACHELGVHHFSRKGKDRYNQLRGSFAAKTKHGNYNAWMDQHGQDYDVFCSVDPDHVPVPNYVERVLGYFRDPNVAYVVGPQDYGNCHDSFVTKAAESQQFPFHTVIQRAANRYNAAMLVGTNNAVRIAALQAIGGLQDSITEDLTTGLKFHASRNPLTGRKWKSVYTPDVLAIGEGPSTWGDYFSQQDRWSRGTFEVLRSVFWRRAFKLGPARLLHYSLIATFYPSMALGWILGAVNAMLYATLGTRGIDVPVTIWVALYSNASISQFVMYAWNRRYNVSPFEAEGSFGVAGMMMSVVSSPIYAASLAKTLIRSKAKFVVTPKGSAATGDTAFTFRKQFAWAGWFAACLGISWFCGYATPAASIWPMFAMVICLAPVAIWRKEHRSAVREEASRPTITLAPVLDAKQEVS